MSSELTAARRHGVHLRSDTGREAVGSYGPVHAYQASTGRTLCNEEGGEWYMGGPWPPSGSLAFYPKCPTCLQRANG
jgi:hypothetical protein